MGWKEFSNNNTRALIAESLRHIMLTKSFDNIRIKDICDEVGVVRVTFYNYFIDKYDALGYLIRMDLIEPNEELISNGQLEAAVTRMLKKIDEEKTFYKTAMNISGQNGFSEQLMEELQKQIEGMLEKYRKPDLSKHEISNKAAARLLATIFVDCVHYWLDYAEKVPVDQAILYMKQLMNNSVMDYLRRQ